MQMTERGLLALAGHEGVVPAPYRDSTGTWTFGIGHTAAAEPPDPAQMARGMPLISIRASARRSGSFARISRPMRPRSGPR